MKEKKRYILVIFVSVLLIACLGIVLVKVQNKLNFVDIQKEAPATLTISEMPEQTATPMPTTTSVACFRYGFSYDYESLGLLYEGLEYSRDDLFNKKDKRRKKHFSGVTAFKQYYDKEGNPIYTNLVMPEVFHDKMVTKVEHHAFEGQSEIRSVKLSDNLAEIGVYAFEGCTGLEKIEFPEGLISIERNAFEGCISLKEIVIPKSVKFIDDKVFRGCTSLESIEIQNPSVELGFSVFYNTKWIKDCREKGEPAIINGVLYDVSGLTGHVEIDGKKFERIEKSAFKNASQINSLSFKNFDILKDIGYLNESIRKVVINNVTEVENGMVSNSKGLEVIVLGKEISKIPRQSFYRCKNLKVIKIKSTEKIKWATSLKNYFGYDKRVFQKGNKYKKLKDIYIHSAQVDSSIQKAGIPKKVTLHVPAEAVEEYQKYVSCKVVAL